MKGIKAYIKVSKVKAVINGLHTIGIENMTVFDIISLGKGLVAPKHDQYSIEIVPKHSEVAKLKIIVSDTDLDKTVETIQSFAYSNQIGGGIIFVSSIEEVTKIRTEPSGEEILPN